MQLPAVLLRIEAEDVETSTVGDPQTGEALDRCRLARAIAPEDAEDLAGSDREAHVIYRDGRPIRLVQVLDGDDRRHRGLAVFEHVVWRGSHWLLVYLPSAGFRNSNVIS